MIEGHIYTEGRITKEYPANIKAQIDALPQGVTKIVGVIVAQCMNMGAATSYSALVRLEGPGLKGGPEAFAAGAGGVPVATGGNGVNQAVYLPIELDVIPAQEILVFGEMCGTDVGSCEFAVTLVFSS